MGNVPPGSGIRVPPDEMRRLVQALFARAGMLPAGAGTMAELLVHTDLRGVFSHGTQQALHAIVEMSTMPRPAHTVHSTRRDPLAPGTVWWCAVSLRLGW